MSSDPVARLNAALEGRYAIERELGEGGMATVYLADDLKHERKVALKVLKPELAAVVGAERFLAEIKVTANLQHPNILPLHDSGEADSFLFYVMPYVEGDTLKDRLAREGPLPVNDAVAIAKDIAEALQAAHEQGVIHRDIKPGNVLISRGKPLISDFGIALALSSAGAGERLTETGLSLGTPYYMSPEQATGDQAVGASTDTYALGCVLYEMLVGEPPFAGSTAQAVLGKIIAGKHISATEERPSVPANVDGAIRKALEKLPADRFASAQDFAKALENEHFRHGELASAGGGGVAAGPWNRLTMATTALAAAFAVAFGWSVLGPDAPELPQLVARFELTLPDELRANTGAAAPVTMSPDGSKVVFVGSSPDGGRQLWLRPLSQLSPTPITGTVNAANPRFSLDGESIAFTVDGTLMTLGLAGGLPATRVADSVVTAGGIAWGPDGVLYFSKTGSTGIWRVSEDGEQERVTEPGPGDSHRWPDVLPNGKGILFTAAAVNAAVHEIHVFSFETGEAWFLVEGSMARYARSGHIVFSSREGTEVPYRVVGGTLLAVPFDADELEVTGLPQALLGPIPIDPTSYTPFALSETGVLVYRPGGGLAETVPVWVGLDGSEEVLDPTLTGRFEAPAISPDGRRVAFQRTPPGGTTDIYIYDLDQGNLSRFTFEGVNSRPFWRPDGGEVGFVSSRDPPGLYARAVDGSGSPRLLRAYDGGIPVYDAIWTPDGGILYRPARLIVDTDLHYAPAHPDSASVVILDTEFSEFQPALSPDGRWLAYTSNVLGGRDEVYVRPFPGPGGSTLLSSGGGAAPVWAHNGPQIFYLSAGSWIVATVRTEPDFAVESQTVLASAEGFLTGTTQNFDVSPDDLRLLAIRTAPAESPTRYVYVLNFHEELNRLVPR
ncbi:MAG: protein kinase [Gemmatimonadetes bacterium]|nr:protein kinase [Gemmatimonadota bacterium]